MTGREAEPRRGWTLAHWLLLILLLGGVAVALVTTGIGPVKVDLELDEKLKTVEAKR